MKLLPLVRSVLSTAFSASFKGSLPLLFGLGRRVNGRDGRRADNRRHVNRLRQLRRRRWWIGPERSNRWRSRRWWWRARPRRLRTSKRPLFYFSYGGRPKKLFAGPKGRPGAKPRPPGRSPGPGGPLATFLAILRRLNGVLPSRM